MKAGDLYTCEWCGQTYESEWSEEEAQEEYENNFFPEEREGVEKAIVCDDCYKKVMGTTDA